MKLIKTLSEDRIISIEGNRGQITIQDGDSIIKGIPVSVLIEVLNKLDSNKMLVKAERLLFLYKNILKKARQDQFLLENRDEYLAIQGVTWEIVQEIQQELPFTGDPLIAEKIRIILVRIEDSNHRLDAILSNKLNVMRSQVCDEIRQYVGGKRQLPTFVLSELGIAS